MDLVNAIKGCTLNEELEVLERFFDFDEMHKEAALWQRALIWANTVDRDLATQEKRGPEFFPGLMNGWSEAERLSFENDWNDDSFVAALDANQSCDVFEPTSPDATPVQTGEGSRKRPIEPSADSSTSKKSKTVPFTVMSVKQVRVKKFKTTGLDYKIQFNDLQVRGIGDVLRRLHHVFDSLLDRVTDGVASHDQIRFIMNSPQLEYPISLPFMPREKLTVERILAEIQRVIQSNDTFTLDDSITVNIVHVEMPSGGTGRKRKIANLDKYLTNKRAIVRIQNKDDLCLARAIVVAKAKVDNDEQYSYIKDYRKPLQGDLARELHEKANVPQRQCGLEEVKKFQVYLTDYQINIVSKEHLNSLIYSGPEASRRIYLYAHDNHYDVITSMPAFLARKKYCHVCKKGYDKIEDHLCGDTCKLCYTQNCPITNWVHCNECNRFFKSQECFDRHKTTVGEKRTICASVVKCQHCNQVVKRANELPQKHYCGLVRCAVCQKYVDPENHQCYIQPAKKRKTTDQTQSDANLVDDEAAVGGEASEDEESDYSQLLFFDFECTQEGGEHVPNLCVVHDESGQEWVFSGPNTRDDFCEWLFQEQNSGSIVMAHNFQGYDGYFILQYLHKNGLVPEVIMRGAKLLTLNVPVLDIKFVDSLCFIPMRLASFPKTFGLSELAKGYFPHHFNIEANQNYVGPLPDAEYYDPDGMTPGDREKFFEWHNNLKANNYVFNFKEEILAYCRSDVDILRRCCLEFRELFRSVTDIDPFDKCLTIASACNLVFRKNFLRENSIAVIPPHGYRPQDKQSVIALKWLAHTAQINNISIRHSRNHGEQRIGKYRVDGFNAETNTVYEFHGCFWHGCIRCYARDTMNPVNKQTMQDLHQHTLEKTRYLKGQNYNVVELWECDLRRQLEDDPEMKSYFDNFEIAEPLEPRHGFYSGRTNAATLFFQCQQDEKVHYVDFTSLYPWTNKYCPYPLGHPEIITENFDDISQYFGLVKCTVLPPRRLYHPVLPYRAHGKLMFPLCKLCTDGLNQEPCNHSDQERAIQGTWVTIELQRALEKGYQLIKVDEVWHFPQQSDELFKEYIDTFLKIKQESSGFPEGCDTEEKKRQYIDEYLQREGIQMDLNKIEKNPGLRALSKLMLNSFWGK